MQDRVAQAGGLDDRRRARIGERAGVHELVGEERQDHEREADGERPEDRSRTAAGEHATVSRSMLT